jgi:hypothetical protein
MTRREGEGIQTRREGEGFNTRRATGGDDDDVEGHSFKFRGGGPRGE